MSEYKCKCQICGELYAVIDLREIKYPINGSMFRSIDPEHGVPPPFYPGAEFEYMRCPFGQHRPMIMPNTIMVENNTILNVPEREPAFFTPVGEERQYTLDRDQVSPMPMMSEEEAGRIARGLPPKEIKTDGKADTQQGQPEDKEPVEEEKKETNQKSAIIKDAVAYGVGLEKDGKRIDPSSIFNVTSLPRDNYCVKCDKQFGNKAGFRNHMRIKHNIKNPEDYNK